nr:uncharacterized protein LOC123003028 [Drosophila takahashii]
MAKVTKILVILLIYLSLTKGTDYPQLRFLGKLINILKEHRPIETMIIIKNSQNKNCSLQHWNPPGTTILRANELASIKIIIVAIADNPEEKLSFYRMNPFPTPQFVHIKNLSRIKSPVFYDPGFNYQTRTAILKESTNSNIRYNLKTTTGSIPISHIEDLEIIEFGKKYNLTLRLFDKNDTKATHFDIQLGQRFITRNFPTQMDFINPSTASSLMVIVPCSQEWRFVDVLKKLGVLKLLLCLLIVYVAFVFVETFILWLNHRMSGDSRRLTSLNPLLNTRAVRAILGLPFPEPRRSSLSLRQLSLSISIFGFICSNFISCKLSAMLTKPAQNALARNFEELRASGLITVTDKYTHSFVESEIDPEFFHKVLPNFYIMENPERNKMVTSLNDSFSFTMLSTLWPSLDFFQRSYGERVFCASDNLTIAWNIPRMYSLENNSIFKWMLTRFMIYLDESGIPMHWIKKNYNMTMLSRFKPGAVPLSIEHLSWLWHLLVLGHSIATVVFIVEIFLSKRNKFMKILRTRSSGEHDLV